MLMSRKPAYYNQLVHVYINSRKTPFNESRLCDLCVCIVFNFILMEKLIKSQI